MIGRSLEGLGILHAHPVAGVLPSWNVDPFCTPAFSPHSPSPTLPTRESSAERAIEGPGLVRYDLSTGGRTVVRQLPTRLLSGSVTLSPDASTLLYARLDRSESNLMLIDDLH